MAKAQPTPTPSDEFDFVSNWPTRCQAETLAAAAAWQPWNLESEKRLPITEPDDDTDTRRNPTPTDPPDDDDEEDDDAPGNVELKAACPDAYTHGYRGNGQFCWLCGFDRDGTEVTR